MSFRNNPPFLLYFFYLCFSVHNHLSLGVDTISVNHSLSGNQTIVSAGGIFELGFYKPGNSSNHHYICMWYKKIPTPTIVWVANRETPILDKYSSQLKIIEGNLVLLNESNTPVWSTNLNSTTSNSVVAVLLDDGNLVLRDYGLNSKEPIWQSFDYPTDTWLPGAKVAYNKRTKTRQSLTSWKNSEDPAPGPFSLTIDESKKQYILLWNRSEQYWTSGPWNGQIFSLVPEMRLNYNFNFSNYNFNFSFVDNENESYFTFSMYYPWILSRFTIDVSGLIWVVTWLDGTKNWNVFWAQPRRQCEVYDLCGAFGTCSENTSTFCSCLRGFNPMSENDWNLKDYSGGCVRQTQLICGDTSASNQERGNFLGYSNVKLPEHPKSVSVGSAVECESACLANCSCTAYAYEGGECSIWIGELLNLQQLRENDSGGKTLYLRLAASEFGNATDNKVATIGAVVGSIALVAFLGFVFYVVWVRKRRLFGKTKGIEGSLVAFAYKDLQNATKNFSEKLGGGGFGSVFRGALPDSTVVAVKKLESIDQGEKQFRTEVSTIGAIQHVNLVRLRGFCSEGNKKLLVYDYMKNRSLDCHLFQEKHSKVLNWKRRYQIALGTARGLAYLHEKCRDCIIHCDVKPENILLDDEFCPKVADFGLAKLVGREFSRVLTTMRGTRGYLAPEWISGVPVTAKADVYSYGMMLFEFISGRRNTEQSENGRVQFFPIWAAMVVEEGRDMISLLDPRLDGDADSEEVRRIGRVACWCIQDDENQRPTMGLVVQVLEGLLEVNSTPIPRFLQVMADNEEHIVFFTEPSSKQSPQPQTIPSTASPQAQLGLPCGHRKEPLVPTIVPRLVILVVLVVIIIIIIIYFGLDL